MTITGIGNAGMNGVTGIGLPSASGLTPEGLMIYLQSRLQGLDTQVDAIFGKQQKNQKVQEALNHIQSALSGLEGEKKTAPDGPTADLKAALQELEKADPERAAQVEADLSKKGQVLYQASPADIDKQVDDTVAKVMAAIPSYVSSAQKKQIEAMTRANARAQLEANAKNAKFTKDEVDASSKYIDDVGKDLGASAQMDMIRLQSVMSSRQTAVQLSTNLIQSLSHSADAIAANTGK